MMYFDEMLLILTEADRLERGLAGREVRFLPHSNLLDPLLSSSCNLKVHSLLAPCSLLDLKPFSNIAPYTLLPLLARTMTPLTSARSSLARSLRSFLTRRIKSLVETLGIVCL